MIGEKGSELENAAVTNDRTLTNETSNITNSEPVVVAKSKVLSKNKQRPTVLATLKSKGRSSGLLFNPDTKKLKRHKGVNCVSHSNVGSNVSSVASTDVDSDVPDSLISPTDEETCSYITEEEFCAGVDGEFGDIVSCSDFENVPISLTIEDAQPALRFSAFPDMPPYLNFCLHNEKVVELPWSVRRYLKWKLSSITPVVVRKTVVNSGFRVIKEPKEGTWIGTWGKHMKSVLFGQILSHQKVNHFPGTFQIGRKDRLWRNTQKMVAKYGNEFDFLPKTYVLPHDLRLLRLAWNRKTENVPWIIKPPASARGTGIQVIHQWSQLPKKRPLVVQSYIENPFLINNTKFDIRLYVFVTSVNPLRIYLFENGLVRFASMAYSSDMNSLRDSYVHLTNYSINKNCAGYVANEDADMCQGHKWTLKSLWNYLNDQGINVEGIKSSLRDIVIKTLISVEPVLLEMSKGNVPSRYTCYELFGFDVLLDTNLKPWLLEVNISPSLHSTSSLDLSVKGPLVRDVFNMTRFHIPSNMSSASKKQLSEYIGIHFPEKVQEKELLCEEGTQYCVDLEFYNNDISEKEKKKQEFYENLYDYTVPSNGGSWMVRNQSAMSSITDVPNILVNLTRDDARHLIETEDEISQSKGFTRIFPSSGSESYFRFMENVRYHNLLLNEWQRKFGDKHDRTSAVAFLTSFLNKINSS